MSDSKVQIFGSKVGRRRTVGGDEFQVHQKVETRYLVSYREKGSAFFWNSHIVPPYAVYTTYGIPRPFHRGLEPVNNLWAIEEDCY